MTQSQTFTHDSPNYKWAQLFIHLAHKQAQKSPDPSTKCGVVIADMTDNGLWKVISTGYNTFPNGIIQSDDRLQHRELKYKFIVHAEVNAILSAAKNQKSVVGKTMFTSFGPCTCNECAKVVIQSGIKTIVGEYIETDFAAGRWADSINCANKMFHEAGIELIPVKMNRPS